MHRRKFMRGAVLFSALPYLSLGHDTPALAQSSDQLNLLTPDGPATDQEALEWAENRLKSAACQPRVTVKLTDITGKPVQGLKVGLNQTKSAFLFGDQNYKFDADAQDGIWSQRHAEQLRHTYLEVFNAINCTCYWTEKSNNSMKRVEEYQGDIRLDSFEQVVDWALANGITPKGHPVFWPVDKAIPKWIRKYDYPTRMKFLEVRVRDLVARFKGKVQLWDLVNEMMWEPAFKNLEKRNWPHLETEENLVEYISQIITWAKEENPTATFMLNEYGVENDEKPNLKSADGQTVTAATQRKRYISLVKALKQAGTPIDAVGLQSHSGAILSPLQQYKIYNEFGSASVPVHITEFWVPKEFHDVNLAKGLKQTESDQLASDRIVKYLKMAVAHPDIAAFFCWNLKKELFTVDADGSMETKPAFEAVKDLMRNQLMTKNKQLVTDALGEVSFDGFEGDYDLVYPTGKIKSGVKLVHSKEVSHHTVRLPFKA